MLCAGSHFVKRKIEVFDAVIILLSFIVDLVFLKGLSNFAISDSIFILAFLLPWRVIRVVNSLVVAVIDHEHVKLRLLYSRKKKLDKTVENLRTELDELKGLLHEVRQFCIKDGMEDWKIDNLLGKFAPRRRKDSKFYSLVKLVMSTASVADDKDSVSSGSMDNEISQFARRESVLNEYDGCSTSNENTVTSFNFLTVPNAYDTGSMISDTDNSSRRSSIDSNSVNDLIFHVPKFIVTNSEVNMQIPNETEPPNQQQSFTEVKSPSTDQITPSPNMGRKGVSIQRSLSDTHKTSTNHLSPNIYRKSPKRSPSPSKKKSSKNKSSKNRSSANEQSPTISRHSSANQLSSKMSRNNSANQLSPTLSRNSSANQLSPTMSRNNSANQLSRNNSCNQLSPDYNGNTSPSNLSRNNSTNELSPISRHGSSNQLTPCLSRNSSSSQLTPCLSRNSSANDLSDGCHENRERVKRSPHRVNFALS